jgi:hypothetical protein
MFFVQTTNMLERHLRIGDALTEDELVEKTMMEGGVNMVRGDPPFKFTRVHDPINGTYRQERQGINEKTETQIGINIYLQH